MKLSSLGWSGHVWVTYLTAAWAIRAICYQYLVDENLVGVVKLNKLWKNLVNFWRSKVSDYCIVEAWILQIYKIFVSMQLLLSWRWSWCVPFWEIYGTWHEWKPHLLIQLFGRIVITGENEISLSLIVYWFSVLYLIWLLKKE